MYKILVVEDEKAISKLITMALTHEGYNCIPAFDGSQACDYIEEEDVDLILLDIMLPVYNGYEVFDYAKSYNIPVIFLTALGTAGHTVKGLELGAEDYISKPFKVAVLIARVNRVIKRYKKEEFMINGLLVNMQNKTVKRGSQDISLSILEFELLSYFIEKKEQALSRQSLFEHVWEKPYDPDSRTIDVSIQRLKKKLDWENEIVSVYGVGYRLSTTGGDKR